MPFSRAARTRGLVLLVAAFALLAGVSARSSALFGIGAFWFALLGLARAEARGRLARLAVAREAPASAFEGEEVRADVVVVTGPGPDARLVEVVDAFGPAISDRQAILEPGPLPARRQRRLRYTTACSRHWGVHAIGPLQAVTTDTLGLFRPARAVQPPLPFALFPRVFEVPALARLGARASLAPQDATGARPGSGHQWLSLRDYRAGDEPRRIHWPATARRGELVVREMELDLVPFTTVFLDLERRHRAGPGLKSTLEYLVRTAASLVWTAVRRGDVLRLFGEGARPLALPAGRGPHHLAFALDELIRVRQDGSTSLLDLAVWHADELPAGSTAVLLSGTAGLDLSRLAVLLDTWRQRRVRAAVIAVDAESFVAIDRLAVAEGEARRWRESLLAACHEHGAGAAVLGADHELRRELVREDLLDVP